MTATAASARALYQTRLVPHRSMTPRQAHLFVLLFGAGSCALSVPFYLLGAWPVIGFMGLDALALYVAFRMSFRSAAAFETLRLSFHELAIVRVGADGAREERRFDTCWLRVETETDEEFGAQRVLIVSRGERFEIGAFLGPDQKAELAEELSRALAHAKRGPVYS